MTVSPARPRTLLFYAPALLDGGAERVWARLASAFAARGDAVTFAVDFEATQSAPFLSRDVALEVLPRGHAAVDARARAPASPRAAPTRPCRRSPSPISSMRSPRRWPDAAIAPSSPITASAKASRSC